MLFLERHNVLRILSLGSEIGSELEGGGDEKLIVLARLPHFIDRHRFRNIVAYPRLYR